MSRNHKMVCTTLSYIEHFLILASTVTGCIWVAAFASLFGIPIGITSSAIGLRQPGFTYSTGGPNIKNKERIQKFKETGDIRYIYQNELNKICFQHDMAYGNFKDSTRRTGSDKKNGY